MHNKDSKIPDCWKRERNKKEEKKTQNAKNR
jgi:hypothetical protein